MSTLTMLDVVKHYRSDGETIRAVDGVSLTLTASEFVALYGPSGSGKTTLLLMAAGLLPPDKGAVLFDNHDVYSFSEAEAADYRRRVGIVFQSFHLMAGASALNNAAMKLLAGKTRWGEARRLARPWLDRVGLMDRHDHKPRQLSMGERQRVAIARALVNGPLFLLADEPTGNLDSIRSREILGLLRDMCHEQGIPGLVVTHDPQAVAFADRVFTLKDGHLESGVSAELAPL